jgi:hypothetical protein
MTFVLVRIVRKRRKARAEALVTSESSQQENDEDDIEKLLGASESTDNGSQSINDRKSDVRKK